MSETKKYYWLKLKKDFFKRHDIKIIESMDNGKDYILFYLKLLVESVGHNGELRFSESIPYDDKMLSIITDTNIDIVRSAVKIFSELNMMETMDDGTIFLQEVTKMVGHETSWAKKKREYRDKKKAIEDKTETKKDNVRQELDKELDKELDIYNPTDVPLAPKDFCNICQTIENIFFDARIANGDGNEHGHWDGGQEWGRQRKAIKELRDKMVGLNIAEPDRHIHDCIVAFMRMKKHKDSYIKDMPLTASSIASGATWSRIQEKVKKCVSEQESASELAKELEKL